MVFKQPGLGQKINNEDGMVLVISLIMLCMLTIIGTAVTNTATIETIISGAEKEKREVFYTAEAGVDHAKGILKSMFVQGNAAKIASGLDPDWDFALNGSQAGISAATNTSYDGGATWILNGSIGSNYTYSVRVWNNADAGSATDDTDGVIYVRSVAIRSQGGSASVEVSIKGTVSGAGSISDYAAQAGSGSTKGYSSDDAEAITDFTQQM